jgi:hypothetical protein
MKPTIFCGFAERSSKFGSWNRHLRIAQPNSSPSYFASLDDFRALCRSHSCPNRLRTVMKSDRTGILMFAALSIMLK